MSGDAGDVFRGFEAAFDLEAGDADLDEAGDEVDGGEVLGAEQVLGQAEVDVLAVTDDCVRHAAGLGTFAAIGGARAESLAGQALAGIGHAKRAVDEDLDGHG